MKINRFEDLDCWKQAMRLIKIMIPAFFLFFCFSAFAAELDIPGSLIAKRTLYLAPQPTAAAPTCDASCAGKIYLDDDTSTVKYCDGSEWEDFGTGGAAGGGERYVATRIVAASNSLDTTCDGGTCTNPRADYTCNGTDDQVEIQDAIDALPSYDPVTGTGGGAVYLLEGTYNISDSINLDNVAPDDDSGKAIIGTGVGTVLKLVTGSSNIKVIKASSVNRVLISQLMIDGNNKTGSSNSGIYFSTVTYSKIDTVWVENMVQYGIHLNNSSNNIISGNNVQGNGNGIYCSFSSSNNNISGNNVQSNGANGIYIYFSSSSNIVYGNNVQSNSNNGIYIVTSSNNNTISGNNIQDNGARGIYLSNFSSNNVISGNNIQGNTETENGIVFYFSTSNNVISGNNIQGNTEYGIVFFYGSNSNNIISGNIIYDNGGTDNYDGIVLSASSDNIISSNLLYDSVGTGRPINIELFTSNTYIVGNLISDWPSSYKEIKDSGTNTKYTQKEKLTIERQAVLTVTNGGYITPAGPASYVPVVGSGAVTVNTIDPGKAIGDMLILEGTDNTKTVTIQKGGNVKLSVDYASRTLGLEDTLTLIWDGTDWLEMNFSNN